MAFLPPFLRGINFSCFCFFSCYVVPYFHNLISGNKCRTKQWNDKRLNRNVDSFSSKNPQLPPSLARTSHQLFCNMLSTAARYVHRGKFFKENVYRSGIWFLLPLPLIQFHREFSFPLGRKSMQASGCWVCSRLFSQLAAWISANRDVRTAPAWKCRFAREGSQRC